jgi:hypothetical protein
MAVYKTKTRHVIDALIVDRAYIEKEVDDNAAMSISLAVVLGPLAHGEGINALLDVREEALGRDQESNRNEDNDESDWVTDSKTKVNFEEYFSEDYSSE